MFLKGRLKIIKLAYLLQILEIQRIICFSFLYAFPTPKSEMKSSPVCLTISQLLYIYSLRSLSFEPLLPCVKGLCISNLPQKQCIHQWVGQHTTKCYVTASTHECVSQCTLFSSFPAWALPTGCLLPLLIPLLAFLHPAVFLSPLFHYFREIIFFIRSQRN